MEEVKNLGLAKSIGISNFNISQIERIIANAEIKPAVLQVEVSSTICPIFSFRPILFIRLNDVRV